MESNSGLEFTFILSPVSLKMPAINCLIILQISMQPVQRQTPGSFTVHESMRITKNGRGGPYIETDDLSFLLAHACPWAITTVSILDPETNQKRQTLQQSRSLVINRHH
ncbi:hypothetical protein NPIL_492051 [Nephila pilipes]|uniref:Uncharacterized protein n=1 Tax=Nephila pilipes TaxID=299642 RepID=A0A8X6P3C2_NEPPI|nr:hypothetical protein NPIL_492051 [Nephila pilipes]